MKSTFKVLFFLKRDKQNVFITKSSHLSEFKSIFGSVSNPIFYYDKMINIRIVITYSNTLLPNSMPEHAKYHYLKVEQYHQERPQFSHNYLV